VNHHTNINSADAGKKQFNKDITVGKTIPYNAPPGMPKSTL
jgi:hypothetical protein